MTPPRKKIRLEEAIYRNEGHICLITICTHDRTPIFKKAEMAQACLELLKRQSEKYGVLILAYCIMPDHLHLLLAPSKDKSIIDFLRPFKSLSTHLARRYGINGRVWQRSFYDHFLRREEELREVAQYILNNPVRKGLVKEWRDYPFGGSFVFALN